MGEESDDAGALFQLALQFRDQGEWFGAVVVQVEDDQRRFFLAVLFHLVGEVFVGLNEFDFYVELARGFLNLGQEEQVFHEGEDARIGVAVGGERFGLGLGILRGETGPLASALAAVVIAAVHDGAVAVVHGRGIDAVFIFAAQTRPGPLTALIVGTATAPSSSASATGGVGWSCVHSPLKLFGTICCSRYARFFRSRRRGTPISFAVHSKA